MTRKKVPQGKPGKPAKNFQTARRRRKANKPRMRSFADFKKGLARGVFSFKKMTGWVYQDLFPVRENRLNPWWSGYPHLLLLDSRGDPRFVLRYEQVPKGPLVIHEVHRERTKYTGPDKEGFYFWDSKAESQASRNFQAKLGGIHPADFLVAQFLAQHRRRILAGKEVILRVDTEEAPIENYWGIINGFFGKCLKGKGGIRSYPLSLVKKKTMQALGIKK